MPRLFSYVPLAVLLGCATAAPPSSAVSPTGGGLASEAELRRDLEVFASDSFGGRATGTPYADKAARWLAARLTALGLEPAGDSSYFHRVPLRQMTVVPGDIHVTSGGTTTRLQLGRDISFLASLGPGAPLPRNSVDAEAVFVEYGLVDPALSRDDYAGRDVAGKVVVIAGTVPAGIPADKAAEMANPQTLFNRLGNAIGRQPAAIVLLLPDSVYQLASTQFGDGAVEQDDGKSTASAPRILPLVAVGKLGGSPLVPAGWTGAAKGVLPAGTRLVASYNQQTRTFSGYNVVGIVRGSDPALNRTYVAYGAHYDHVGIGEPVNGDSINNGADDDGSGSVTLLAIAKAFVQGPRPKRSALFVWHIGEENGLFGSDAFTTRPPPAVPLDSIVAQLNADMIGRNASDSLYIVGPGAAPNGQSSVLGAVVDSVNTTGPRPFVFNREWDTTTHPERIYYRSDHYNYARKGIPIVFFTTGLHPQYHKPTDEPALIDYAKMRRVGELMLRTGMALGNRSTRPRPPKPIG